MLGGGGELHALTPVRGELMRRGNSLLLLFSHSVGSDSSAAPMGYSPPGSSVHGIL